MSGGLRFETLKAGGLREEYLARLAERRAQLRDLARQTGWRFMVHRTDTSAHKILLDLHGALGPRR